MGLLAAGLSHHIRNSLVAVKTFLDLAPAKLKEESIDLDGLRNPEFWKDYYHNVQGQIEKINGMLKDLWSVSEERATQFKDQVRLHEVVAAALSRVGDALAAKGLRVENTVPDSLPVMSVDKFKFERLFELLFKDEAVSLPAGSVIAVSARSKPGDSNDKSEIQIELKDNGPGLPKEALRLIFDPFTLRSDSPLEYGINLMAVYFIVHHQGGRIAATRDPGQGTTFQISMPVNCDQAPRTEENEQFLHKVLLTDQLWEKLMASE
jgi:two-component system probable response regulator PhcQ